MASTAATIRVEWPRLAPHLASVLLGAALLVLAGPRLIDEMALLRPAAMVAAVDAGARPSYAEIVGAARAAEAVADGPVAARANRIAGQLHMAAAARRGGVDTITGRTEFDRAADRFSAALALAPGDRFAWWWLVSSWWSGARHLAAARAFRAAILSGPFDYVLIPLRTEGGIALWPYLDAPARAAFGMELVLYWRWETGGPAYHFHRFRAEAIMWQALADWPDIARDTAWRMSMRQ